MSRRSSRRYKYGTVLISEVKEIDGRMFVFPVFVLGLQSSPRAPSIPNIFSLSHLSFHTSKTKINRKKKTTENPEVKAPTWFNKSFYIILLQYGRRPTTIWCAKVQKYTVYTTAESLRVKVLFFAVQLDFCGFYVRLSWYFTFFLQGINLFNASIVSIIIPLLYFDL